MIFVGEIAQTNELVVGNGFNTTLYDLDTVDSFTGNINSVNRAMERKRFVTNTINHLG